MSFPRNEGTAMTKQQGDRVYLHTVFVKMKSAGIRDMPGAQLYKYSHWGYI